MRAFQVNRDGASVLADEAAKANVPLIHLSTDYVFDGSAHARTTRSMRSIRKAPTRGARKPASAPSARPTAST